MGLSKTGWGTTIMDGRRALLTRCPHLFTPFYFSLSFKPPLSFVPSSFSSISLMLSFAILLYVSLLLSLSLQCHEMVVRGQLPACEEDLQTLAALRLQSVIGDFSTHSPYPPLDELFPGHMVEARLLMPPCVPPALLPATQPPAQGCPPPQRFPGGLLGGALWNHTATAAHKQKVEQDLRLRSRLKEEAAAIMSTIVECWKGLAGYSRRDSMAAYLTIARQWSGFGCTLYEVDFYIVSTSPFSVCTDK